MTAWLLDTNILLRLAEQNAPEHPQVRAAVTALMARGDELHLAPQALIEFWVVATRPVLVNGFGWEPATTAAAMGGLLRQFPILDEGPSVFAIWLQLVSTGIRGKRAHDMRLAAVAIANGVSHILTLNTADFTGIPGIVQMHPNAIAP